uniref:Ig-like domain-containing protein n=1 Tax=Otolemur garnettii TaxID=30611 RepID=H0X2P4_OTOGA
TVLQLPSPLQALIRFSSCPGTHSLRYFRLGVSDPGRGLPELISVGYVDSYPITTYDSVAQQKKPKAPWRAENLVPSHWERYRQLLRGWQQTTQVELKQLQRRHNHSGHHTYWRMTGCEVLEDGSTGIAVDNVVHVTKRVREANQHELQYQKNWLEEECITWLKRLLGYGKDVLPEQLEPPLVRVHRKETFPGITTLQALHGFYSPEISMIWMRNGEEMDSGDILPSGDGTYQTRVSVELDPQSTDVYSCYMEHCGLHIVLQESESIPLVMKIIFGSVVLAMVLTGIGLLAWRRPQGKLNIGYLSLSNH